MDANIAGGAEKDDISQLDGGLAFGNLSRSQKVDLKVGNILHGQAAVKAGRNITLVRGPVRKNWRCRIGEGDCHFTYLDASVGLR